MRNILIHTDLTEASDAALDFGRALAEQFRARLHVLHVVGEPLSASWTAETPPKTLPELHDAIEAEARERLSLFFSEVDLERLGVSLTIRNGGVSEEITRHIEREAIDLVIIGEAADQSQEDLVRDLVSRTSCSLLVVRGRPS
jgi:nucleotide-binding universal stress UspA family protein